MSRRQIATVVRHSAIKVFAEGLDHPECVCWHPNGELYAGGEEGQVYRISSNGRHVEEIARTGGFALGIAVSPDGTWLAVCDFKNACVWRFDLDARRLSVLSRGTQNLPMQIPNHVVFDRNGQMYVSDSGSADRSCGRLYRVTPVGETMLWHEGPFHFANGVAIEPSQKALLVVCTWASTIERIELGPSGEAAIRSVYLTLDDALPDGLAFDALGKLYISCYAPSRIYQVQPGSPPQTVIYADDWTEHRLCHPTNICFGGVDGRTMYIANLGRWHIASIEM